MKTGRTLQELAVELDRQRQTKRDFIADTRRITADVVEGMPVIDITPNGHTERFSINDIAHTQIAENVGIPSRYYNRMRDSAPELWKTNVNHWLQAQPEKRLVRTLDGHMRAMLSDRFRPMDHCEVAEALLPAVLSDPTNRVESCQVTDKKFYLKVVSPRLTADVKKGDPVQAGIVISNSEVGLGALSAQLMIYRLVCTNGMIAGTQYGGMRTNHLGGKIDLGDMCSQYFSDNTKRLDNAAFFAKLSDTVRGFLSPENFQSVVKRLTESTEEKIMGDPIQAIEVVQKQANLSDGEKTGVLRHLIEGGDLSRYGIVNAITRYSQDVADYDRATELEQLGGKVLELHPYQWRAVADAGALVVR